jgi:drug/metabolite transporter (DMT)-like permease
MTVVSSPVLRGFLWGGGGVVAFGLTLPMTRLVVPVMDPVFIGLGRAVVAALVAIALLWASRAPLPTRQQWLPLSVVAAGVVLGFPVLSAMAMQTVPAAHGGVVLGLLPLATALASVVLNHERPSPGFWITAAIGAILVVLYAGGINLEGLVAGDLLLLGATVSAAIGYAVGGRLSATMGGWRVICWALVMSLPVILVPTVLRMPLQPEAISIEQWAAFGYLALVSQLAGFFLWNRGLALGGVARVSQVQLLQPFVTLVAATFILGELWGVRDLAFALLVVASVALNKRTSIKRRS